MWSFSFLSVSPVAHRIKSKPLIVASKATGEDFWGIHPVHESQVPFLWELSLLPSRVGLPGTILTKMWPRPLAIVDWTGGSPLMGAVPTRNVTSRTGTGTTELFSLGVCICSVQTLVLWTGQVSQRLDWPEFLSEKRKKETFLSAERRVKNWSVNTAWAHHDLHPSFSPSWLCDVVLSLGSEKFPIS